jgi:hypothetical protein
MADDLAAAFDTAWASAATIDAGELARELPRNVASPPSRHLAADVWHEAEP